MPADPDALAVALRLNLGLLLRRLRQLSTDTDVPLPEMTALSRLDRGGPCTTAELARQEEISPQSMGATVAALERRGLVARAPDPGDGRRMILSLTPAGAAALSDSRDMRTRGLAAALRAEFTPAELDQLADLMPLLERLAQRL